MNKQVLFLVILALGAILALRFFLFYRNQPQYRDGQSLSFALTLLSEPQIFEKRQRISADLPSGKRIVITTLLYPQFHYSDKIAVAGNLRIRLLKNKSEIMVMNFPKIEAVKTDKAPILALASLIRQKTTTLFERTLPPISSSLLLGIVFGVKEQMPKEFMDNLRISGVLHVVAASGMNVTLIGGFLSSLFSFFFRRQIALIISVVGILFYAVLAGLEASIIRASLMGILVFSAAILGRQTLAWYGLALTGFLMLLISPVLLFDVGFQLSFAATLGLLYLKPLFAQKERVKDILEKSIIGGEITITLAAQIATLPILLANFGTYSFWSVIVNGLVLWSVPILMIIGGLGAILGLIVAPLGTLTLYLALPLLAYFEKIVKVFAAIPGIFKIDSLPWQIVAGYYGILFGIVLFLTSRIKKRDE